MAVSKHTGSLGCYRKSSSAGLGAGLRVDEHAREWTLVAAVGEGHPAPQARFRHADTTALGRTQFIAERIDTQE